MIDSPLKGWAPLFGVYGVTWAAATIAVAVNVMLLPTVTVARRLFALSMAALLFAIPAMLGHHAWTRAVGPPISVAAVQGAVPQDQKWQAKNRDETMERYSQLTADAWGAQLIVWPESALPILASEIPDYLRRLKELGHAHGSDFAIGLVNYDPAANKYYNGLLVLSDSGGGWYYKRHLVPFGEYFPVPGFVRSWMRLMSLPYTDITAGGQRQPTLSAAGQKLGLTICYEDAFGAQQLRVLREATLLINVTNNAWFGDSTATPQHLQIGRMRALEAGRYLVVAANDGITAVIGPQGEVVSSLPQFQKAVLRADVQPMTGLTPYARFGNIRWCSARACCWRWPCGAGGKATERGEGARGAEHCREGRAHENSCWASANRLTGRHSSFPRSIRNATVKATANPRATDLGFCLAKPAAVLVAPRRVSRPFFSLSRNTPFISPIDDSTLELNSRISGLADRPNLERSSSASASKSLMALKFFICSLHCGS
jgi:apolipoprotein N-acyltransferase